MTKIFYKLIPGNMIGSLTCLQLRERKFDFVTFFYKEEYR